MDYYSTNLNSHHHLPQLNYAYSPMNNIAPFSSSDFLISDFLILDDDHDSSVQGQHDQEYYSRSQSTESSEMANLSDVSHGFTNGATSANNNNHIKSENGSKTRKGDQVNSSRIAFRTRSELDVMDDGYKWRKYGKKSVKNSPNLRNYYKCSSEGCNVKKRVERDREDSNYVITTYDGVHNHASPYY